MESTPYIETKEAPKTPLTYHHSRPLEFSPYGIVTQHKPEGPVERYSQEERYAWLGNEIGFYPLFMAVGRSEDDKYMTQYHTQWRRKWEPHETPAENLVMFSYKKPPTGG